MNEESAFADMALAAQPAEGRSSLSQSAPPYRLYDSTSVTIATLLGSPVAGTGLIALNYRRLGKPGSAALAFATGVAVTALGIAVGSLIPSYASSAIAIGLLVATMNAAKSLQGTTIREHVQKGGKLGSRWAASGLGLACLVIVFGAAVVFVLASQSASKIVIGSNDEVYFSGSATKRDAQALGAALQTSGYFRGNGTSVILSKDQVGTAVSFVVKDGIWNQPDMISGFEEVGREVALSVGGFPIKLRLANSSRRTMKELTVGKLLIGAKDELYYFGSATESDAKALGQSLKSSGFLQDRGASVFLSKGNGETAISFVLAEGAWDKPQNVAVFEVLVRQAAGSLGGLPIKLRLVNSRLDLEKEVQVNN
jgi:hypothetical protein